MQLGHSEKNLLLFSIFLSTFCVLTIWPIYEKHWFSNGSRLVFAIHILLSRTRTLLWAEEHGAPAIEIVRRFAEHATRCRSRGEKKTTRFFIIDALSPAHAYGLT